MCELVTAAAAGWPQKRNRGRWHIAVPVAAPVEEEDGVVRLEDDQADVAGMSRGGHLAVMCIDVELDALEDVTGARFISRPIRRRERRHQRPTTVAFPFQGFRESD